MAGKDHARTDDPREAELAERGRLLVHAAVTDTVAPLALRERIESARARERPLARRRVIGLAGSFAAVAAAAAAAIVISIGGSSEPSVPGARPPPGARPGPPPPPP